MGAVWVRCGYGVGAVGRAGAVGEECKRWVAWLRCGCGAHDMASSPVARKGWSVALVGLKRTWSGLECQG